MTDSKTRLASWPAVLVLLIAACLAFWKFRVIATGEPGLSNLVNVDINVHHYPITEYAFTVLKQGRIPLWNPYQQCGVPFLATSQSGIFYPGNIIYLIFESAVAIEVALIAHLVLAGMGMWLLSREYELSRSAGLAASATFMWSGWMVFFVHQAFIVAVMCWLPITIWLVERTIRGSPFAPVGVAVAIACQFLIGATEFIVYNTYVVSIVALFRLVLLAAGGRPATAASRALMLGVMAMLGLCLSAPQLLPTVELAQLSVRGSDTMTLDAAREFGVVTPSAFLRQTLRGEGRVLVGFLPFFGLILGSRLRGQRSTWFMTAALAGVAALLVFGGNAFELYFRTPFGSLFRAPHKLLHIYAFAQAILAAIAIAWFESAAALTRRALWVRWDWLVVSLAVASVLVWGWQVGDTNGYLAAAAVMLGLFGFLPGGPWRSVPIVCLLLLQAGGLFTAADVPDARPIQQREVFDRHQKMFGRLGHELDDGRIYISPRFISQPSLTLKQGLRNRVAVVNDYEVLTPGRHAAFIEQAANRRPSSSPFNGVFPLSSWARLRLMDLMSTRYYVVPAGSDLERMLNRRSRTPATSGIVRLDVADVPVYERSGYMPRAYVVGEVEVVESGEAALARVSAPDFQPRRQVVIEAEDAHLFGSAQLSELESSSAIIDEEPERVLARVESTHPGFLVLTDTHYPGWRAYVDGVERKIYRANYLFRAVYVEAGTTDIVFEYRPDGFRHALYAAGAAACLLIGFVFMRRRTREAFWPVT